jgi:hypothetical protein
VCALSSSLLSFVSHSVDASTAPATAALDTEAVAALDGSALAEDDVDPIDKLQQMGVNAGEKKRKERVLCPCPPVLSPCCAVGR